MTILPLRSISMRRTSTPAAFAARIARATSACVTLAGRRAIFVSSPGLLALARRRLFLRLVPVGGRVPVGRHDLRWDVSSLRGSEQELLRGLQSFRPFF